MTDFLAGLFSGQGLDYALEQQQRPQLRAEGRPVLDTERRHYAVDFSAWDKYKTQQGDAPGDTHQQYVALDDRDEVDCYRDEANVLSSELNETHGWHAPVLDIDFPCRLEPSSTPGHFHLYLDGLVMPWADYEALLNALAVAGVIEHGYAEACIARKSTMVRLPGVQK